MVMFSEDDSTRLMVTLGVIGTLLGVVIRFITHSHIAVLVGAVGGLLVAFLLAAVRGEQV
jgi:multisubunit Na+/H+ antiporter MnhG subunit